MNGELTYFSEHSMVNNDNEVFIFVPKPLAQRARQYLSNKNIFINHKSFEKSSILKTGEDALGIPIKLVEVQEKAVDQGHQNSQYQAGITICEKLATFLSLDPALVEIKFSPTNLDRYISSELPEQNKCSKGNYSANAHERLKEAYIKVLNEHNVSNNYGCLDYIPKHWEIHDDLILFPPDSFKDILNENSPELAHKKLCDMICDIFSIKRIAIKTIGGIQNDDFRSPSVALVYGFSTDGNGELEEFSTWAKRTENRIVQTWDITKSMFCVGNITEKLRVAVFDCHDEVVVDLFAGIGYFVLPYLIHAKAKHVFACEWNPSAIKALKRNLYLNRVDDSQYTVLEGDNRIVAPTNVADRVNLGLIPSAAKSYKTAVNALRDKSGGILHIHANVRRAKETKICSVKSSNCVSDEYCPVSKGNSNSLVKDKHFPNIDQIVFNATNSVSDSKYKEWKEWSYKTAEEIGHLLIEKDSRCTWEVTMVHIEHVKPFAPFVDHLVLDLKCKPMNGYLAASVTCQE